MRSQFEHSSPVTAIIADGGGQRHDAGKPRYDLMPPEGMDALAQLYALGSRKYAERNWERGMSWGKCFACLMRHSWKWMRGEDFDPETGVHHMIHAAWNAIAIFVYAARKIGTDDRPHNCAKPDDFVLGSTLAHSPDVPQAAAAPPCADIRGSYIGLAGHGSR